MASRTAPADVAQRALGPDHPNEQHASRHGNRAAGPQLLLRRGRGKFQQAGGQAGSEGPKQTLDHQYQADPYQEVIHRVACEEVGEAGAGALGARGAGEDIVPFGLLKYWKNSVLGEMTRRVSFDFSPSS